MNGDIVQADWDIDIVRFDFLSKHRDTIYMCRILGKS